MADLSATIVLEGKNMASSAMTQAITEQQALYDKIAASMAQMSRMTAASAAAANSYTAHAVATRASADALSQHTTNTQASTTALGQHTTSSGAARQATAAFGTATETTTGLLGKFGNMLVGGIGFAVGIAGFNALTGAMTSGAKGAIDLQQSVANISTVKPDIDTSKVFASLNEISTRVPQDAQKLGDGLYNIFSSVEVSTEDGLKLVEKFAKGAVGAATDAQTFGTAAMGVMNAYDLTVQDADHISDVFFNTVKSGVVTGQELAQNLGLVTQAAKLAGVDLDSLGGFIAGVTKEGGPAAQNMNNLNNLFMKITTKEAAAAFRDLGIQTVTATGAMRPQIDVLTDLKTKTDEMSAAGKIAALQKIFPDLQARAGASVIIDQLDFVKGAIAENITATGSAEAAYTRMSGTAKAQFTLLGNAFSSIQNTLIAEFLPAITSVTRALAENLPAAFAAARAALAPMVDSIKNAVGGALQTVADKLADTGAAWAAWAAQAGDAGTAVSSTLTGTSKIVQALQFLLQGNFKAAWVDAKAAMGDFGKAMDAVGKVISDHRALILGVVAAFVTFSVLSTVTPLILGAAAALDILSVSLAAAQGASAKFGVIFAAMGGPVTLIIAGIVAAVGVLTVAWINNWGDIQGKTAAVWSWLGDEAKKVFSGDIAGALDDLTNVVGQFGTNLGARLQEWGAQFRDWIGPNIGPMLVEAGKLGLALEGWMLQAIIGINVQLAKWGVALVGWVIESTPKVIGELLNLQGRLIKWLGDQVPSIAFQLGKWSGELWKWVGDAVSKLPGELAKVLEAIKTWVSGTGGDGMANGGGDLAGRIVAGFVDAITKGMPTMVANLGSLFSETLKAFQSGLREGGSSTAPTPLGPAYTIGGSAAVARPTQINAAGLTEQEALAACGPAAVVAFAIANGGRAPRTISEAVAAAKLVGWTTAGMGGPGNEQRLLAASGMSSTLTVPTPTAPISEAQIQQAANTGAGAIISTTGHYFTASGYDETTGKYNVGTSGSDLRAAPGETQMTLARMVELEGSVNGLLSDIKLSTAATAEAATSGPSAGDTVAPGADLRAYARGAATRAGISPDIFERQIQQESGFDPNAASKAGAIGIAQFMPGTAAGRKVDPHDPLASLEAAAQYDAELLKKYGGSWEKALAAYNAGEGHVDSGAANAVETQQYLATILGLGSPVHASASDAAERTRQPQAPRVVDPAVRAAEIAAASAEAAKAPVAELGKLSSTTSTWLAKSQADEARARQAATDDAARKVAKIDEDTPIKIADLTAQRDVTRDTNARKTALAEQQQDDQRARAISDAAAELSNKRTLENSAIASARSREDAQILVNDRLAHEALVHSRAMQDADVVYQKGLQLEATKHARTLEDAQIVHNDALQKAATEHSRELQDEQTAVSRKLANAELLHQRALQDAQIAPDQTLEATAIGHSRGLEDQNALYTAQKTAERDAAAYQEQLANAQSDAERDNITKSHDQALHNLQLQAKYAAEDLAHRREMEDAERVYQEGLQVVALAKQRALQDAEIVYQAGVADKVSADQRARDDTEAAYQRGLRDVEVQYSRGLADTEQAYRDDLAQKALEHSRGLQDAEIEYQKGIAHAALMAKRADEDAAMADARKLEDAEIARKIARDAEANRIARDEKHAQDALDQQLADEALARAIVKTKADAEDRKKDIADELALRQAAIVEQAQLERATRKAAFDETAAEIIAKAKEAVEKAGGDFAPIEAAMTATVAKMDLAFATADANSSAALVDLATVAATAMGAKGTIPNAVDDTTTAMETALGRNGDVPDAIAVSDKAVELFGQRFGLSWNVARPLLGQIEQGIYTNMGANGLIPHHIAVSDKAVEDFAHQWGVSWPEARGIMETQATAIKNTFGEGGSVPADMGVSAAAAIALNTAIQGIQDKTITVTTNFGAGVGAAAAAAASGGGGGGGSSGGGGGSGSGSGSGSSQGNSGSFTLPNIVTGTSITVSGSNLADAQKNAAAQTGVSVSQQQAAGTFGNNTQQGLSFAVGGLVPGPAGAPVAATVHGGEFVLPVGSFSMSGRGSESIDYEKLAQSIVAAMGAANFSVGIEEVFGALQRKKRRGDLNL